jgi:hypothetical protein
MVMMMARIAQKQDVPLEYQEQQWLVDWLTYHILLKDFFHKTNNEGKRALIQGHRLKRMGLRPGASDIFIYYPTKTYSGLWLEVKRNKKYTKSERSTPTWIAQEIFLEKVKGVGYAGYFCYGWVDGKEIVERYLLT